MPTVLLAKPQDMLALNRQLVGTLETGGETYRYAMALQQRTIGAIVILQSAIALRDALQQCAARD